MPDETLTCRLSLDAPTGAHMDLVLDRLTAAGLVVEQEGRRGFAVSGSASLIESVFNSHIDYSGGSPRFTTDPKADILPKDLSYRVFFPTRPEYF